MIMSSDPFVTLGSEKGDSGIAGEGVVLRVLTLPLAGSKLLEAVGAACLLRPPGPEPLPHLPPKNIHTFMIFVLNVFVVTGSIILFIKYPK